MLKGERRERLVIMDKHPLGNTNVYTKKNDYFLNALTKSFSIDVGTTFTSTTARYENMRDELWV